MEIWRCQLPVSVDEDSACANIYYKLEAFREHMRKDHKMEGCHKLDRECCRSKVGRNGQGSFWCGFCEKILPLQERAIAAWDERYKHIEEHYLAGQLSGTWLCITARRKKHK